VDPLLAESISFMKRVGEATVQLLEHLTSSWYLHTVLNRLNSLHMGGHSSGPI